MNKVKNSSFEHFIWGQSEANLIDSLWMDRLICHHIAASIALLALQVQLLVHSFSFPSIVVRSESPL